MIGRLGLLGRLVLIVLLLLLALVTLSVGLSLIPRSGDRTETPRFPLPDQIAGVIELLDLTDAEDRDAVLRAVQAPDFLVRVENGLPEAIPVDGRMPAVEWLIAEYLETLQDRVVIAVRDNPEGQFWVQTLMAELWPRSRTDLLVIAELADGSFLHIEIPAATSQRLFGVPVGFWVGVFGCLFAALAFWAIAREARPLRALVQTVERFGTEGIARPLVVRGAPEIRRLIGAVNAMQSRIATLIMGRTILIGAVSHDLKTFITRLRLRVEEIPSDELRGKAVTDLEAMTQIVDDALTIARGSSEPARRESVDIADLLREEITARGETRLDVCIEPGTHLVSGDRLSLRRLMGNLIDNALRYGRRVEVSLLAGPGVVRLQVDDDGPGIAPDDRTTVFEPFVRLDESRSRETGGSGLGLAIVRQVAESHGGRASVSESPLGGAGFEVVLPACG